MSARSDADLAVTYGRPEDRKKSREAGFDAQLVKPLGVEMLNEALGDS